MEVCAQQDEELEALRTNLVLGSRLAIAAPGDEESKVLRRVFVP